MPQACYARGGMNQHVSVKKGRERKLSRIRPREGTLGLLPHIFSIEPPPTVAGTIPRLSGFSGGRP